MAKQAILQVRMQSIEDRAMPFTMHLSPAVPRRTLGIANGRYTIPDDIDSCNDKIAEIFEVKES